jgi:hypothetical protein
MTSMHPGMRLAALATLVWTGIGVAASPAQQSCDYARVTAWTRYVSCVDGVVAKNAQGATATQWPALAKCRENYSQRWMTFQSRASLLGSSCHPQEAAAPRFAGNADGTITDELSGLVWEKKTGTVGGNGVDCSTMACGDPHDVNNTYQWCLDADHDSTCDNTSGGPADGDAFTAFLATLNDPASGCFAGDCDWRLPTVAELQTILLNHTCTTSGCTCEAPPSNPCIDPALGPTQNALVTNGYWSATTWVTDSSGAWNAPFDNAQVYAQAKASAAFVRAVRGGF